MGERISNRIQLLWNCREDLVPDATQRILGNVVFCDLEQSKRKVVNLSEQIQAKDRHNEDQRRGCSMHEVI